LKHIIALLDGTQNAATRLDVRYSPSNVFRIAEYIDDYSKEAKPCPQMSLYFTGVGADYVWKTRRSVSDVVLSLIQAATSYGIEQQIVDAFMNISVNYDLGDKVYLIGFSRGAVAAKVLCDLIGRFGLIKSEYINHFGQHWDMFTRGGPSTDAECAQVKKHFTTGVTVEFLGLFDAVAGSLSRRHREIRKYVFGRFVHPCVLNCIHILSMDEQRRAFSAVQYFGIDRPVLNVWMPGCHSDVGGCYHHSSVKDWSLYTMLKHLSCAGVQLKARKVVELRRSALKQIDKDPKDINLEDGTIWRLMPPLKRTPFRNPISSEYESVVHPVFFYFCNSHVFVSQKRKRPYDADDLSIFKSLSISSVHEEEWDKYRSRYKEFLDPLLLRVDKESTRQVPVPGEYESATAMR
jgi:hypothetical protein